MKERDPKENAFWISTSTCAVSLLFLSFHPLGAAAAGEENVNVTAAAAKIAAKN